METNKMELTMDELETVNGGDSSLEKKLEIVATAAGSGAALGVVAGGGIGSMVPVVGTVIGGTVGATVGAAIFGGGMAIRLFLFD